MPHQYIPSRTILLMVDNSFTSQNCSHTREDHRNTGVASHDLSSEQTCSIIHQRRVSITATCHPSKALWYNALKTTVPRYYRLTGVWFCLWNLLLSLLLFLLLLFKRLQKVGESKRQASGSKALVLPFTRVKLVRLTVKSSNAWKGYSCKSKIMF